MVKKLSGEEIVALEKPTVWVIENGKKIPITNKKTLAALERSEKINFKTCKKYTLEEYLNK
jgi:hypothetical protein